MAEHIEDPAHADAARDDPQLRPVGPGASHAEPSEPLNRSTLRSSALLLELGRHPAGASAAELAATTGVPRPTAFRLLLSMTHAGLLERDGGTFMLGWRVARLGRAADPYRGLLPLIQRELDRLAARTGESVHYSAVTGATTQEVIAEADGTFLLGTSRRYLGAEFPLHASVTGKLMLAQLPPESAAAALPDTLEPITRFTITEPDILLRELAEVRARGYATLDGELEEHLFAVAVPVYDDAHDLSGILATSGLDQRMKAASVHTYVAQLQESAGAIASLLRLRV